ncbi:Structural maintenance of chromosomes protein 6 [Yarrowia sp. C11]|nr:Structural maintenance of chromosomes protein 6 [Yarrowia sp. C11]KAG5364978.1 Structural maintenance of chromosomes protein 6 [Yarrowia sp. E02]
MSRARDGANEDDSPRPQKRQNTRGGEDAYQYHHPGFIRSVECINFMCHKNLKIDVGPGITFVSGQNGHGKSAILTALIQVFSTDRKMKGERGTGSALRRNLGGDKKAKSAKIIVKINNKEAEEDLDLSEGGQRGYSMSPFEPETYGDVIIVEREIFEKSKKLRIMTEKKEVISEKMDVLLQIMKHFSYQFDNRLVIQTQENAKKRGDPKSLFDFFYNGSGFESIENDLAKMQSEISQQNACLESSLKQTTLAKKELRDKLKAECELTAHTKELYDNLQRYKAMFKWLEYSVVQRNLNSTLNMKMRLEDKSKQLQDVGQRRRTELEELSAAMEERKKGDPELESQISEALREKSRYKDEKDDTASRLRQSKRDMEDILDEIKQLNNAIGKLRAERDHSSSNTEHERLDAEIRECEKKVVDAEKQHEALKVKLEEKRTLWRDAGTKTQDAGAPIEQKERELRDVREEASRLEAMSRDRGNPIAVYGQSFIDIDRTIQANKSKFRRPPLGPIGQYIKIKPGTNEQEVKLINSHQPFKSLLKSYVVATREDERTLRGLLPRRFNFSIYCITPDTYDLEKISPPAQFKTILRCLDVSEPRITQTLVDWASVHSTAIIGGPDEAVRTLKQGAQNLEAMIAPHATSGKLMVTVTQKGFQLSSSDMVNSGPLRIGKVTVTADEVAEAKRRLAKCEQEIKPLKDKHRLLRQEEGMALQEVRSFEDKEQDFQRKIRQVGKNLTMAISEKHSIPEAPSTDETDHTIEMKTQEVKTLQEQLSDTRKAVEAAEERSREITNSFQQAEVHLNELSARRDQLSAAYEELNIKYSVLQDSVTATEQKIELAKKKLEEKETQLLEFQKLIESKLAAAQALSEEHIHLDDGIVIDDGFTYVTSRTAELEAKIQAARDRNLRDYRVVYSEFQEAEEAYRLAKEVYDRQRKDVEALKETAADRVITKGQALQMGIMQTSTNFTNIMKSKAASADIGFDLENRKLEVKNYKIASTSKNPSKAGARDVATTSGGEHSFLQSALMSALWRVVDAPIICLDEYEVFMDDSTRVTAQKNLVNTLGSLKQRAQAILISPTVVKNSAVDDPRFRYVEVRDPSFAARTQ